MTEVSRITVLSQNILLDKTREKSKEVLSQSARVHTIARGILNLPYRPNIIGIQEAHIEDEIDNGRDLATACGYETSTWVKHNKKATPPVKKRGRNGEFIGLIGVEERQTEIIELGDQRRALMTEIGGVAFATLHFRAGGLDAIGNRLENAQNLIAALRDYEDAVLFGDFNEPRASLGRGLLKLAGYTSVFGVQGKPSPKTYPLAGYKELHNRRAHWALDDILVRGNRVLPIETGVLSHDSKNLTPDTKLPDALDGTDHSGVWARLSIASKHD